MSDADRILKIIRNMEQEREELALALYQILSSHGDEQRKAIEAAKDMILTHSAIVIAVLEKRREAGLEVQ